MPKIIVIESSRLSGILEFSRETRQFDNMNLALSYIKELGESPGWERAEDGLSAYNIHTTTRRTIIVPVQRN